MERRGRRTEWTPTVREERGGVVVRDRWATMEGRVDEEEAREEGEERDAERKAERRRRIVGGEEEPRRRREGEGRRGWWIVDGRQEGELGAGRKMG